MKTLVIKQLLIPESKYALKCPFWMKPEGITIHNTANRVSAIREASFSAGNDWEVSSHYYVDEVDIVQSVLLNRNCWHASDGTYGFGNRNTICIEICRSTHEDVELFKLAEKNAANLTAALQREFNIPDHMVKRHYDYARDKKYCPHKTMDLGWQRWLNMVKAEVNNTVKRLSTEEFIEKIKDDAISGWNTHEILPSLTIAQAILESDSGNSELAVNANAIFGIKAHTDPSWVNTYEKETWEYVNGRTIRVMAKFKAYKSWKESLNDRLKYLMTRFINGHYIYASLIGETDYKKAAKKIYDAGYATDPTYTDKLIRIIERHKLYEYDLTDVKEGTVETVIAYVNDGDLGNALALFNCLGGKAVLYRGADANKFNAREVIQVGGTKVYGATSVLMGSDRVKTLQEVAKYFN